VLGSLLGIVGCCARGMLSGWLVMQNGKEMIVACCDCVCWDRVSLGTVASIVCGGFGFLTGGQMGGIWKKQHFKCYLSKTITYKEDPHWCSVTWAS